MMQSIKKVLYVSICVFSLYAIGHDQQWARCYRTTFSAQEQQHNMKKNTLVFSRQNTMPFSQAVVSWNARRPQRGYFSFSISARDARTKQWGGWHTMMEWGCDKSCSYINTAKGLTSYYYARLEVDKKQRADAFRVRVRACDGASLGDIHALNVALSDFTRFRPERKRWGLSLPSVYVEGVPAQSQFLVDHAEKERICSPASCTMLARFVTGVTHDAVDFAQHAFDSGLNAYGSWAFNIAHLYERLNGAMWTMVVRLNAFSQLHQYLQKQLPVVVSVRGELAGAPQSYDNGHLLLVVGWDMHKQQVICHDPAAKQARGVVRRYAIGDFLTAWERSRRLAYLAIAK